ncbi:uncharacterized protein BDV17DRAFT_271495 [Aspergillus undulatus]|uniref:uncharacterized protein n=1 Tax=Aspergillus undulatus TaxID=1810928 RepID=UPI003CCCD2D8
MTLWALYDCPGEHHLPVRLRLMVGAQAISRRRRASPTTVLWMGTCRPLILPQWWLWLFLQEMQKSRRTSLARQPQKTRISRMLPTALPCYVQRQSFLTRACTFHLHPPF